MDQRVAIEFVLDYMCNFKDLISSLSGYATIEFNESFSKSQIESIEEIHTIFEQNFIPKCEKILVEKT